ncbi:MAG: single-stranded-DNA-specific exonuclease RecJ [Clostridia bacterium]|nr:single-stranded-DNA-specific exonuclease RecJ [Clostridia bacterium]
MSTRKEKIWNIIASGASSAEAKGIAESVGISEILATLLVNRGYNTIDSAKAFIGKSTEILHDPFLLNGMREGAERILRAVEKKEKISVYGDYDVDGVTSVSIVYLYLESIGGIVDYYIPNRKGEGYGVSEPAVRKLAEKGTKLIVTVDTGVTALNEVKLATELGIDTVITDHHECPDVLPDAVAVINPKRKDTTYPFQHLAGVGVSFKLLCALEVLHTGKSLYTCVGNIAERYADLTAIGTIADVMPVIDENRLIVSYGLARIDETDKIGLSALINLCRSNDTKAQKSKVKKKISSGFVGFTIAPRINAAGRICDASLAVELFLSKKKSEAEQYAVQLCDINKDRQLEENRIADEAFEKIVEEGYDRGGVIILDDADWNHGVIGIVASRVTEKYALPSILISFEGNENPYDENAVGKGSGRSIYGMNLVNALSSCADLLDKFGGHELAAGLSVRRKNLNELRRRMTEYARACFNGEEPVSALDIDCILAPEQISRGLATEIGMLEPYGVSNTVPLFAMKGMVIEDIIPVGMNRHLKLILSKNGMSFTAMQFCTSIEELGHEIGDEIDIAFNLEINEFMNVKTVQFNIKDIKTGENIINEQDIGEREYELARNGDYTGDSADVIPNRDEFGFVYNFLLHESREGISEYTYIRLLHGIRARKRDFSIGYAKLKLIIKVFRELNIVSITEKDEFSFEYRISYTKTKTSLDKSSILRKMRTLYQSK